MTFRNTAGAINGYTHTFNVENELVGVVNNGSTTTHSYLGRAAADGEANKRVGATVHWRRE